MAGFTWDDVKAARAAQQASELREGPPATYKVPGREWKDPGIGGAIVQGVDRFARNLSDGIVQTVASARGDDAVLRGLKGLREPEDAFYKQTQESHPFASGLGEGLPYALVPGGPLATAIGVAGIEGMSYGTPEERAKRAAIGGTVAGVAGVAANKVGSMLKGGSGPGNLPTRAAVKAADDLGAPLSVGQRTGIEGIQRLEDLLFRAPGSSSVMAKHAAAQQRAVNEGIATSLGAKTENGRLTQDAVAAARNAFNVERNALKASSPLDLASPGANQTLNAATSRIAGLTDNLQQEAIAKIQGNASVRDVVTGIVNKQSFTGEQYQALRTALKDATTSAYKSGDTAVGEFYKTLRSGLDDIAQQGQKKAWRESDVKAATLKLLEDTTHVWNVGTGNVSAANFGNRFSQVYGAAAKEGRIPGKANDVLLFSKGIRQYPEGSQTAGRQMFNSLPDMVLGPVRWLEAQALTSPGLARAAEAPARWLSSGVWPNSPNAQALTTIAGRQMVKGAVGGGVLGLEGPYVSLGLLGQ